MNELSLFSGAGSPPPAPKLLGWRTIGYVEWDEYCQRVIRQRINDGILDNAPIYGDVRAFVSEGYATAYQGMADVVSGGFPCQPFSVAGKQRGADDERNMWPATIATIRAVRPRFVFLENVPGLLNSSYFGTIITDLAESGFSVRWRRLSAAELGAPHRRDRLWIVAHTAGERKHGELRNAEGTRIAQRVQQRQERAESYSSGANVAHPVSNGRDTGWHGYAEHGQHEPNAAGEYAAHVADTDSAGRKQQRRGESVPAKLAPVERSSKIMGDAANANRRPNGDAEARSAERRESGGGGRAGGAVTSWWQVEPDVGRVAHGVASRVDRLKSLGNGQVPIVAATAWRLLTEDLL